AVASNDAAERCKALQSALKLKPDYPEARKLYAETGCSEADLERILSKRKPCAANAILIMAAPGIISALVLLL
ncbi:MAG TPA: hypothetical protein VJZ27_12535, partial [Aggregatilineales bacterium]|nr:hypothetical protein [Aggregatilineales bacterium]